MIRPALTPRAPGLGHEDGLTYRQGERIIALLELLVQVAPLPDAVAIEAVEAALLDSRAMPAPQGGGIAGDARRDGTIPAWPAPPA